VRVCCFWASTGVFYRHGRARELGFPVGVWRETFPVAAALAVTSDAWVARAGYCGSSARATACS
jgi:hypothetical protein